MKTPIEKLLEIITLKEKENAIYLMPIIDKIDIDKLISEEKQLLIHSVSSRTFSKVGLKNAYLQGYRKRAIISGLKYDNISEQNAIVEFNNWFDNLYGY